MTYQTYTANQWPGAPRELPPPIQYERRTEYYVKASQENASVDSLFTAYADIGQRLAKAMHSPEAQCQPSS